MYGSLSQVDQLIIDMNNLKSDDRQTSMKQKMMLQRFGEILDDNKREQKRLAVR